MLPSTTRRRSRDPLRRTRSAFDPGLDTWMDDWLDRVVSGPLANWTSWSPTADLFESDDAFVLEMELAGFERDDLEITVDNGVLTVRGERPDPEAAGEVTYYVQERTPARFSRSFSLPRSVDADRVEAKLDNGLLRVTLSKSAEAKPRRIAVQTA